MESFHNKTKTRMFFNSRIKGEKKQQEKIMYAIIILETITSVFVINYISTWWYLINHKFQLSGQEMS